MLLHTSTADIFLEAKSHLCIVHNGTLTYIVVDMTCQTVGYATFKMRFCIYSIRDLKYLCLLILVSCSLLQGF